MYQLNYNYRGDRLPARSAVHTVVINIISTPKKEDTVLTQISSPYSQVEKSERI